MEPAGSGATWTGSPKGVFAERKYHKPRVALNNITAGVREPSEDANRTWVGGRLDEIQGFVANTLNEACGKQSDIDGQAEGRVNGRERVNSYRSRASLLAKAFGVGFIDWLGLLGLNIPLKYDQGAIGQRKFFPLRGNLRKRKAKHVHFTISKRSSHGNRVSWLHLRGRRGKPARCIQCGTNGACRLSE